MDSPSELKRNALSGVAWDVYALPLLSALETLQRLPEVLRAGLAGDHLRAITNREAGGAPRGWSEPWQAKGSKCSLWRRWSQPWRTSFWPWPGIESGDAGRASREHPGGRTSFCCLQGRTGVSSRRSAMRSAKAILVTRAVCLAALLLAACTSPAIGNNPGIGPTAPAGPLPRLATATPFQPQAATPTPSVLRVWLSPALPQALRAPIVSLSRQANGRIDLVRDEGQAAVVAGPNAESPLATWIYTVVAPFPTVQDGLTIEELRAAWTGGRTLLTDENTAAAFQALLGGSAGGSPTLAPLNAVLDRTWAARPALAVVPFEALDPRWKVLELDGVSPIRKDFDPAGYPLVVSFGLSGRAAGGRCPAGAPQGR